MKKLLRLFDLILNALAVAAGAVLMTMMLATVVKVVLRVFFNHGLLGIDQVSGIMMVYLTFFGAAWVLRNEGHVTIDILTSALPEKARRVVGVVCSLVGAAACLTIAYFSTVATGLSIQRGVMVAAELEIPRAVNLWAIPFGCTLLGLEFLRRAARIYTGDAVTPAFEKMEA